MNNNSQINIKRFIKVNDELDEDDGDDSGSSSDVGSVNSDELIKPNFENVTSNNDLKLPVATANQNKNHLNIPESIDATEDLKNYILKAFIESASNQIKDKDKIIKIQRSLQASSVRDANLKYFDERNFLIFKDGNIRLDYFKKFAL